MQADTLIPPRLTSQEHLDLVALAERRDILARSEVNHRAHALIEHTRILAERVERFLEDYDGDEANALLPAGSPAEPQRWGTRTFADVGRQFFDLGTRLQDFLSLAGCDLPPLPHTEEVPHVG